MAQHPPPKLKDCVNIPKDGSHMFVFTNDKAGMTRTSADKERANRIIHEMSKNSLYFKQAELQDQKVDAKVSEMKAKIGLLDIPRRANLLRQADKIAMELEAQRELDSACMVVDMDMFYAAVEIRDRPELADKPVAVGGEAMISTTNYHARKWGVRSAMPGFIGRRLCPELVFVHPDFEKYKRVAEQIRTIFREYDPRMRSYSLDEAYLNVTQAVLKRLDNPAVVGCGGAVVAGEDARIDVVGEDVAASSSARPFSHDCSLLLSSSSVGMTSALDSRATRGGAACGHVATEDDANTNVGSLVEARGESDADDDDQEEESDAAAPAARRASRQHRARMFETAQSLAEEIRRRIREETKLTASVGIGPNFMLAKIASDWNKPDGQFCVSGDRAEVLHFLHDLPVRKVGGVGKVMEKCLREALGVVTCGDLFHQRAACMHVMTPHTSRWLIKASLGIGSSDHDVATEQAEAAGIITRKQISKERTFGELYRPQDLLAKCKEICEALATEMASKNLEAKTVGLKIKTTKFQVRTLDSTGSAYISTGDELYAVASSLLQREIRGASSSAPGSHLRLRLMGVKASAFRGQTGSTPLPGQPTLDSFLRPNACRASESEKGETKHDQKSPTKGKEEPKAKEIGGADLCLARKYQISLANDDTPGRSARQTTEVGACGNAARPPTRQEGGAVMQWHVSRGDSPGMVVTASTSLPVVARASCPVCNGDLGAVSNAALNRHVDACLGVETLGERGDADHGMSFAKRTGGGGFGPRRPKRPKAPKLAVATTTTSIKKFLGPR